MKNVCSKVIIKDYLLEDENSTLKLNKENYLAGIFMPKKSTTISQTEFIYKVDENKTVKSNISFVGAENKDVLSTANVDSSWFNVTAQQAQIYEFATPITLETFTAIDTSNMQYLTEAKTLFEIIKDGKYNIYFSNNDNDYSNETLLLKVNSVNYLMLDFESTSEFNFIDFYIEYE